MRSRSTDRFGAHGGEDGDVDAAVEGLGHGLAPLVRRGMRPGQVTT